MSPELPLDRYLLSLAQQGSPGPWSLTLPCQEPTHTFQERRVPKQASRDFPGGTVVKNPPADTGDTGWIPGPGRSHMLRSN